MTVVETSRFALDKILSRSKAVVFDCYNTLVVDEWLPPPVWQHLNSLGYRSSEALQGIFEPDGFDGAITPRLEDDPDHAEWCRKNLRTLLRLSGVGTLELEDVLESVIAVQESFRARPAHRAEELVCLLRTQGYRLGVCSNWESPLIPFLRRTGLQPDLFDAIVSSAEVGARKPHPQIFAEVCGRIGVSCEEALHIGDSWFADVGGALRSGLSAVWLTLGRPSKGVPNLVPEFASVAELYDIFAVQPRGRTSRCTGGGGC